jgi:histidinol dehydrogenase
MPIEKVGIYVPGGTAPLLSSLLMLAIPAKLAGCETIVICSPPDRSGDIHPSILAAAHIAGVQTIFKAGGAQAIAAMGYGTQTIPQVYKIFGPGNRYVTLAKQKISLTGVAIDMPAGPSEVAIIADREADPEFVAWDLLSQAEHGPDSQVLLVTDSPDLAVAVSEQVRTVLMKLPRKEMAEPALLSSHIVIMHDLEESLEFINQYAPEHLIINTVNASELAERVRNAGSVFIGPMTPESAGDYASGTNHTLPTNASARAYSGVTLESFRKTITFQQISPSGLRHIGPAIERLATEEGLEAHRQAVAVRLKKG